MSKILLLFIFALLVQNTTALELKTNLQTKAIVHLVTTDYYIRVHNSPDYYVCLNENKDSLIMSANRKDNCIWILIPFYDSVFIKNKVTGKVLEVNEMNKIGLAKKTKTSKKLWTVYYYVKNKRFALVNLQSEGAMNAENDDFKEGQPVNIGNWYSPKEGMYLEILQPNEIGESLPEQKPEQETEQEVEEDLYSGEYLLGSINPLGRQILVKNGALTMNKINNSDPDGVFVIKKGPNGHYAIISKSTNRSIYIENDENIALDDEGKEDFEWDIILNDDGTYRFENYSNKLNLYGNARNIVYAHELSYNKERNIITPTQTWKLIKV